MVKTIVKHRPPLCPSCVDKYYLKSTLQTTIDYEICKICSQKTKFVSIWYKKRTKAKMPAGDLELILKRN
jgi:hypothetical protein